jgi:hypothetical protein
MRLGWAILVGLLLGGGLYWSFGRDPAPAHHRDDKASAHAQGPSLYRWHDQDGIVHITDAAPPKGVKFERIPVDLGERVQAAPAR